MSPYSSGLLRGHWGCLWGLWIKSVDAEPQEWTTNINWISRYLWISRGTFSAKNSEKSPHRSPVRGRFEVSLWVRSLNKASAFFFSCCILHRVTFDRDISRVCCITVTPHVCHCASNHQQSATCSDYQQISYKSFVSLAHCVVIHLTKGHDAENFPCYDVIKALDAPYWQSLSVMVPKITSTQQPDHLFTLLFRFLTNMI